MQTTHGGPAKPPSTGQDQGKSAARQLYRDRRRAFAAGLDEAARTALLQSLKDVCMPLTMLAAARAAPVASYASVGAEIDPQFVEQAFGPHCFPRVDGTGLRFHVADWSSLEPGVMGIAEPAATAPEVTPRLLLVPLIAATLSGTRLGQGGGYYDRALAILRATAGEPIVAVGLAWECQIADLLPHEPHDALLDWIATPRRLVDCKRNR